MTERGMLTLTEEVLGWPSRDDIFQPGGGAKRALAESANRKIGGALRRLPGADEALIGILAPNPGKDVSDPPVALVCEFPRAVTDPEVLLQAQRLAWNFSLSPLLITVEPHLIRSFTCCDKPGKKNPEKYEVQPGIRKEQISLSHEAARSLHWVDLVSGQFFQKNQKRFNRAQRADQLLLNNLKYVRKQILRGEPRLDEDVCHDLLARIIFIQFLIDRRDSKGNCALDSARLKELSGYSHFWEVLRDKNCSYDLFRTLNERFNGDLFSTDVKNSLNPERDLSWEKEQVDQTHLNLLAELVEGTLKMDGRQLCLWRQYSFDVIPLEFISSIYETFVTKHKKSEGIYYTPQEIVDFVLDGVLPWDGTTWDLKIVDPSCGSGVFLVKAFQRLVYRWTSQTGRRPSPEILKQMLQRNILGIDNNRHAVRVAAFSLYLAMCEHIEPVNLWEQTLFPKLRNERIICGDFFDEEITGFRTSEDAESYDLVIGNAPWGKGSISESEPAQKWASDYGWEVSEKNIGPIFLPKSAALTKPNGTVSMIQSAKALLFNRREPAQKFRKRFFQEFEVEEVVNLSAVRFQHFAGSDSPVCIVTFSPSPPDGNPIAYICPKPRRDHHDKNLIIIDPQDINTVSRLEILSNDEAWTVLAWGGPRDLHLIRDLMRRPSLKIHSEAGVLNTRGGIIRGDRKKKCPEIVDRRLLQHRSLKGRALKVDAALLPINDDPWIDGKASTDFRAFAIPQLILKKSWLAEYGRFRAVLVIPDQTRQGILIPDDYVTVHAGNDQISTLETACLTYNSILAVYFLLLISGRFSGERPTVLVEEALSVPLPERPMKTRDVIQGFEDVDEIVHGAFGLSDVEWTLIEDMVNFTVPYYKSNKTYPAEKTKREKTLESEMELYSEYFLKVLRAGFGNNKRISCVAFVEPKDQPKLPVRILAVYFDSPLIEPFDTEEIDSADLYNRLNALYSGLMKSDSSNTGGILFQRIARIYDVTDVGGEKVPTVYLIKPDQVRYWTRSMALRDADDVAADIMSRRGSEADSLIATGARG